MSLSQKLVSHNVYIARVPKLYATDRRGMAKYRIKHTILSQYSISECFSGSILAIAITKHV